MQEDHLERIRRAELESVREHFRPGMKVLEIGGGSGFQAALIASWGCEITSIDLAERQPPHQSYFAVQGYNGRDIPFPDESFDMVFSSNVLEHIRSIEPFLREMHRVLKPDGQSLHILPSSTWRFWTSLTHYIYAVRWLFGVQPRVPGAVEPRPIGAVAKDLGVASVVKQLLLAGAHGEYPNAFAELYYYSRGRWSHVFSENGFQIATIRSCDVFHTGYAIFPNRSIAARKKTSRWIGSSCFALSAVKKTSVPHA